jgi:ferrochelatase
MTTRRAIVLVNLGTPDTPTPRDVRRFLKIFLSDPRVVNLPRFLWLPILYGIILPFRSAKVARLYQKIWWPGGSPLKVIAERQAQKLAAQFAAGTSCVVVRHAMVYSTPSLETVVTELHAQDIQHLLVLPLYPQYCSATTGSVQDQVETLKQKFPLPFTVNLVTDYHDHELYIDALATSVQAFWAKNGRGDLLLFSFHGIPQALVDSGDPYYPHCHATAGLVARKLKLAFGSWRVAFQSRFGKAEWAKPYTDVVITELAHSGLQRVDVITPSFASDCLETLEEIAIQNAAVFVREGGKQLSLIPCLNDSDAHIAMMQRLFEKNAA